MCFRLPHLIVIDSSYAEGRMTPGIIFCKKSKKIQIFEIAENFMIFLIFSSTQASESDQRYG